jgi:hypothetical protein
VPTVAATPQLNAIGLRVIFDSRSRGVGPVVLNDITDVFQLLDQVYAFSSDPPGDRSLQRSERLRVHRLAMNSPLELLASIPPAFVAGLVTPSGLSNFLSFFERVFNLPLAIKVDRDRLLADEQGYRSDRLDHELGSMQTQAQIDDFKKRAEALPLVPRVAEVVDIDDVAAPRLEDRMAALARANDIRTERSRLKKDLRAGRAKIENVLLDPPDFVATAKVLDLVMSVPQYGRVKADRILRQAQISPSKTVGAMSERQRVDLVRLLRK